MEFAAVLNELQQKYDLKENEIAILRLLIDTNKKLDAREISRRAKIPMGRIYDFLNELMAKKLVRKTDDVPAKYFTENFEQRVYDFLNHEFEREKERQLSLMSTLELSVNEGTRMIRTDKECILEMMHQTEYGNRFRVLVFGFSVPFIFYPEDKEGFIRMRNLVVAKRGTSLTGTPSQLLITLNDVFNRRHHARKRTDFILASNAVEIFVNVLLNSYGKSFAKSYIQKLKTRFIDINVGVRVTNEDFPYYFSTSEKSAVLATTADSGTVGIVFESEKSAQFFSKIFDTIYKDCKDISVVFDEYLKKL